MTSTKQGLAFVLGALLYAAEEHVLGYLSAIPVPTAYFDFFATHKVIALSVEEAALVAFPAWLLALGWGLVTTRLVAMSPYRVAGWAIAGLVTAWFARSLQGVLQRDPWPGQDPFPALLLSWLVPPVWSALTSLSAPLGVLAAGVIAHRARPPLMRTAPRGPH